MIKKISKYSFVMIMLSLLMLSITYFYKVYVIVSPIKLNYFSEIIDMEVRDLLIKQIKNEDIKLEIEKSTFELNKLPSPFRLNLSNVKIKNKNNSLNSYIRSIVVHFSIFDLINNFVWKEGNLNISDLEIDRIGFSLELNEKGFNYGPMFGLISHYFTKNVNADNFQNNIKKFKINNIDILLNDKKKFFEESLIKLNCNNIFLSKDKLNMNCKKNNSLDFNLNLSKSNSFYNLSGIINKLNPKLINLKKINLNKKIHGNIITRFKIILNKDFKLENIKLDLLKSSFLNFSNKIKNPILSSNQYFNLYGSIDWIFDDLRSRKETINIKDLIINENNKINGKILRNKNIYISKLSISNYKINNGLITKLNFNSFGLDGNQSKFFNELFINSKKTKFFNVESFISLRYEKQKHNLLITKLKSSGKLKSKDMLLSTDFLKKGSLDFNGSFNFHYQNKKIENDKSNFNIALKGKLKNINLSLPNSESQVFFKKGELSGKINSDQITIEKLIFYENKNKNFSLTGSFFKSNQTYKISKLDLNISNLNSKITSVIIEEISEKAKFSENWVFNSGKLSQGNVYVKLRDKHGKKLAKKIIFCKFNFEDIIISSAKNDLKISFNKLKLNFDSKTQWFGESDGLIEKIPFKINFNLLENLDLKAFGNIKVNEKLEKILLKNFKLETKSLLKINFNLSGNLKFENYRVNLSRDLNSSMVKFNLLNFHKNKNTPGFFRTTLFFNKYKLKNINNFELSNSNNKILSKLIIFNNKKIIINNLLSKNFDVEKIILKKISKNYDVFIKGDLVDIGFLRKNLENKDFQINKKIKFDIISTNIYLGQNLFLSGNFKGMIFENNIESKVLGKMSFGKNPLLDEGEIKISIISDDATLNGKGLVGGAKTYLRIKSFKNKLPRIFFQTEDGGKLLERLKFTSKVKSGEMTLEIKFLDHNYDSYEGIIRGINFNIIKVPGVVKALSSLGFSGVNSLFVGQGVGFDEGIAKFVKDKNIMSFEKLLINNDRLSIFLSGKYNTNNENIEFVGSIAPMQLISKIISVVPAVGELLTGLDKEGIFAGQFKLNGTINEPKIDLNELSFAPGILRDIFSRDWIKENKFQYKE